MNNFKQLNTIAGWATFAFATLVYLLTIEPTASLWDCGEFIATSYKLEVGHPPGASLFMLIARFFSLFAPSVQSVGIAINIMSALCSSFTILFLFWSITHLARRIYEKNGNQLTTNQIWAVLGAGLVGALAFTFSDTFWFSAVEGEVYAMSSLFTALVFWVVLKWEEEADQTYSNRWLILLAYLMGLSVGVHLLNLLALPAIVLVYYFKKYKASLKGTLFALFISIVILGVTVWGIIPGVPAMGQWFELLFVNDFGLPFNSGFLFYIFLLAGVLAFSIYYTYKINKVLLNTIALCVTMIVLGYSSLATVLIRSEANTPINENAPDNVFSLDKYLSREQYGDNPLFSGPSFVSPPIDYVFTHSYTKDSLNNKPHYAPIQYIQGYIFNPEFDMVFPRMYSRSESHIEEYKFWTGMRLPQNEQGQYLKGPKSSDNLRYMFNYQFGWMYMRYFMWNFSGRQNDVQGHGGPFEGNWVTGLNFIDDARLGINTADMPPYLKENKGRNNYFLLPFILGLIGMVYQFSNNKRNFAVVAILFIMTGIAIAFYLNMPPLQPRERDYVFAGSFYAFAIWIGLGVLALYDSLKSLSPTTKLAPICATAICLVVPAIMGQQNWDDHNRSKRYVARDLAFNYLNTCGKNAILYTFGDNDTFPLWYAQEVEEHRTDVRIMNTSLLTGDWYIDQMRWRTYDSPPVPFSLPRTSYLKGVNDMIAVDTRRTDTLTAKQVIDFIANPKNKRQNEDFVPTRFIAVPVDKAAAIASGIVAQKDEHLMADNIYLTLTKNSISKAELMTIDLLANYKWDRPIHFASSSSDIDLGLLNYVEFQGMGYKLTPIYHQRGSYNNIGRINTDTLYHNLMAYKWGNVNNPNVLVDQHCTVPISLVINARGLYARLANALLDEQKNDKAIEVLNHCAEQITRKQFPYNISQPQQELAVIDMIQAYFRAGDKTSASKMFIDFAQDTDQSLKFFTGVRRADVMHQIEMNMAYLQQLSAMAKQHNDPELEKLAYDMLMKHYNRLVPGGGRG